MSPSRKCLSILILSACALFWAAPIWAGAVLKLNGKDAMPVFTRSVTARAEISGQFARTTLVMVFQNESQDQVEADFIYAIPPGAVATYFAYWAGDEKVEAKIVEKKEAARIYQQLTSYSRDPALIEFKDKNTFRARISPVFPNHDLKVEIRYVQSLRSSGDSVSYSVPIGPATSEQTDPLESVDASVVIKGDDGVVSVANNYGVPVAKESGEYRIVVKGNNYRPPKDLSVRVRRKSAPLRAELCAEPASGHFSLALTPGHSLKHPTVSISGVKVSQMAPARLTDVRAGQSVVVSGRYRGSGKALVRLSGRSSSGRKVYTSSISFAQASSEGVSSRIWAAARISDLGSKKSNRKAVVALSLGYGLPSRYTSWLAVPKAEMQSVKYEKVSGKIWDIAERMKDMIVSGKQDSPDYHALEAEYNKLHEGLGEGGGGQLENTLSNSRDEAIRKLTELKYADEQDPTATSEWRTKAERVTSAMVRVSPDRSIDSIDKEIENDEQYWLSSQCCEVADKLTKLIAEGKSSTSDADKLRAKYERLHADIKDEDLKKDQIAEYASYIANGLAWRIVDERHKSKPNKSVLVELNEKLRWIAPSAGLSPEGEIRKHENSWVDDRRRSERDEYILAVEKGKVREAEQSLRRYYEFSKAVGIRDPKAELRLKIDQELDYSAHNYFSARNETLRRSKSELKQLHLRAIRLAKLAGRSLEVMLKEYDLEQRVWDTTDRLYEKADLLTAELVREHPFRSRVERLRRNTGTIASELKTIPAKYNNSNIAADYNAAADLAIEAWLEEQRVKSLILKGAAGQDELKKASEKRGDTREKLWVSLGYIRHSVRGGDPLISVEAPEDALRVIALLPDGDVKTLVWNANSRKWEARFDIPTGTPDGDYVVTVVIMLADGTRRVTSVNYKVDNTPPSGLAGAVVSGRTLRLEVKPNEDVARVVALLPWGERVELRRAVDGGTYNAVVELPVALAAGKVEFILTDNAHNRASVFVGMERQ